MWWRLIPPALAVALGCSDGTAQEPAPLAESPRLAIPYPALMARDVPAYDAAQESRAVRLRMFNMPSGFLIAPLGIQEDEDVPADQNKSNDDLLGSVMQVNLGMYNPNFDLHLPGDPGGLGYYKLYTQLQLLDEGTTSVCLDLHAYTPAGLQMGGLANGPTVAMPAISWFQELWAGTALQGYFGQSIHANSAWRDNLRGGFHYGMALQYPLPGITPEPKQGVYLFLQAMGRYRYDGATDDRPLWEVLPGLQWRWSNTGWMSLGVFHRNFLTCGWQY